jgi:mono/diheme cytochrome c family protein
MNTTFFRRILVISSLAAVTLAVVPVRLAAQIPAEGSADVPEPIPAAAKNRQNPWPATAESIESGGRIFASQCAMCHGAKGDGKGDLAARLLYKMPDFTAPDAEKRRTDGELFYIVDHGHGRMTGEGDRLSDDTKWSLVNYVRSLARKS